MRVVGDVRLGRLGGHHVRVERAVKVYGAQHRAQRAVLFAALRAQGAAKAHRIVKAGAHAAHGPPAVRESAGDGGGARGGPVSVALRGDRDAIARFTVLATGGSGSALPERGQLYQVETGWRLVDGDWRLLSAEWTPAL